MLDIEIICHFQPPPSFYEEHRSWLDEVEGRRLFIIDELGSIPEHWTKDRRVSVFHIESPLQEEPLAKRIAHLAASKELIILDEKWKSLIEPYHRIANSVVFDAAKFGVNVFRHLQANTSQPTLSFLSLQNAMAGTAAIIVGAGPSLERETEALERWKDCGLILSAGHAIQALHIEPDLAVAIDPHTPLFQRKLCSASLCFQGRVHPSTLKSFQGAKLYLPDTHFPFESWLMGQEVFSSGWTAGNVAAALAVHLGCDPIILVGMDYCYRGAQKYAEQKMRITGETLIPAVNAKGESVHTRADWLLAVQWMEELARAFPSRRWINATSEDGLRIGAFTSRQLDRIDKGSAGVGARWQSAIEKALPIELDPGRLEQWRASLARCKINPEGEIASELLLDPLWRVWGPLFELELMLDEHPLPMEQKLAIQKGLFFSQVIDEHLI